MRKLKTILAVIFSLIIALLIVSLICNSLGVSIIDPFIVFEKTEINF
jgi:hypothetical protein